MRTAIAMALRHACRRRGDDALLLSYLVFVVYFILFAR
jgi:hypothetical protein